MKNINLSPYHLMFYLEQKIKPQRNDYNIAFIQRIKGKLEVSRLSSAVSRFTSEHFLYHSVVCEDNGEFLWKESNIQIALDTFEKSEKHDIEKYIKKPFNLNEGPLCRFGLFGTSSKEYVFVIVLHHILTDGCKYRKFVQEFSRYYNEASYRKNISIEEHVSNLIKTGESIENAIQNAKAGNLEFWKKHLERMPQELDIAGDVTKLTGGNVDSFDFSIPCKEVSNWKKSLTADASLSDIIMTVFALLVSSYAQEKDIILPYSIGMEGAEELANGSSINSIFATFSFDPSLSFSNLIEKRMKLSKDETKHGSLPVYEIAKNVNIAGQTIILAYTDLKNTRFSFEGCQTEIVSGYYYDASGSSMLFDYEIKDNGDIDFRIIHTDKYSRKFISQLAGNFTYLIKECLLNNTKKICDLSLVSSQEYQKIIRDWNLTDVKYDEGKTIHQWFEEQAAKTPDNVAVVFGERALSYKELNEKSNQLAHTIRLEYKERWGESVKKDTVIGLYIERSAEMIIGILGILKSGAAYVPFDMADPEDRLKFKINDCGCKMMITSSGNLKELLFLSEEDTIALSIDSYWDEIEKQPKTNPSTASKSGDLAYIIYTSGSTGRPKGVMIEHKNVINLINSQLNAFSFTSSERVLLFASVCFDASVEQMFLALMSGSTLYVIADSVRNNPAALNEFIIKNSLTHIHLTPSYLKTLGELSSKSLKRVIAGAEYCDLDIAMVYSDYHFINEYGPTETTVTSIQYSYDRNKPEYLPIGRQLENTKLYILDKYFRPVPVGVPGELYISGAGVSRGYFKRPELTQEKFIGNPFATEEDKKSGHNLKMYKTGDVVKWSTDGNVEFIGRNDDQIKIRGFRVELGEIESKMMEVQNIKNAVVVLKERKTVPKIATDFTNEEELNKALAKYRNTGRKYDVLVPISGGVDSCFTLIKLVNDYKLKPLVFHFDHGWENPEATDNVRRLCKTLNVDLKIEKTEHEFFSKLFKYFNESPQKEINACLVCGNIIYFNCLITAEKEGIPLVINGYSKGQIEMIHNREAQLKAFSKMMEIASAPGDKEFFEKFKEKFKMAEKQIFYRTKEDIEKPVDFNKIFVLPFFVFKFYKTDKPELQKFCKKYFNWEPLPTSYPSRTTNCKMIWFNSYVDLMKNGYNLYYQEYSGIIREGEMSRGDAFKDLEMNPPAGLIDGLAKDIGFDQNILSGLKLRETKQFCKKCLLPDTFPGISYDESGVCCVCRDHEKKKISSSSVLDNKYLAGYYTVNPDTEVSKDSLFEYLSSKLPAYMVPGIFVKIDEIPLDTSGKTNKRLLPEPEFGGDEKQYVAPVTELEKQLAQVWEEILGVKKVGTRDDFFKLGGDSILSIKIISQLKKVGLEISVADIFENKTIEKIIQNKPELSIKSSGVKSEAQYKSFSLIDIDNIGESLHDE